MDILGILLGTKECLQPSFLFTFGFCAKCDRNITEILLPKIGILKHNTICFRVDSKKKEVRIVTYIFTRPQQWKSLCHYV